MVGNPYRYRAALKQLENRHATAGCLLALLFVIPFAARTYSMAILVPVALLYICLVVPLATGYVTLKTVMSRMRQIFVGFFDRENLITLVQIILFIIYQLHNSYVLLEGVHRMTQQVLFFLISEKVFCPEQRLVCLYVLLFYTVLAYLHKSLKTRHWTQLLNETSTTDFIKLTTAFIIVRLGKGVAMSLVLLTFTLQFNHLEPSFTYVIVTSIYFLLTQYDGEAGEETSIVKAVKYLGLHVMEGMEDYWIPFLIHATAVEMSTIIVAMALTESSMIPLCLLVIYTNVYVAGWTTVQDYWKPLAEQKEILHRFPLASPKKLAQRDETTCPICLDDMRFLTARVTPCNHVFHGSCLRRCVLHYSSCPLCKQPL